MKPTIGRIVWYYADATADPCAAIVVHVHGDGDTVNLSFFHHTGTASAAQCVPWLPDNPARVDLEGPHWVWPPRG